MTELDAVTVTATRNETTIGNVPATVTVIDSKEIDKRNVNSIRDLIRYEPGVSIGGGSPQRTGNGNYVIRGIGENRVLVTVDGVRVPDFPANSQPGTYFRDTVDLENVKRVEIVRGAASALYGSDAIGGVVAYITKDPADYLSLFDKNWYVGAKTGFNSADMSFSETATLAARAGDVDMMLLLTRRDGQEIENNGSRDANPQDYLVNNALAKLVYHATPVDQLRLTLEAIERNVETDIRTDLGPVTGAVVTESKGDDHTVRRRITLDHVHSAPIGFVDAIRWQLSYQDVFRNEHTDQRRVVGGTSQRLRVTDQDFKQEIVSLDLQLESRFNVVELPNRLTYGFDVDLTQTSRPRDRTEYNLTAGTSTKTVAGETFPTKTFPDTDTILGGAYVQNEITALGGRLTIIPAVRVDYYKMDPGPDAAFNVNNPGSVDEVSESEVSPKLGAIYRLTDTYSIFGQYAHGFRSPPYDDANIGFTNNAAFYRILPNPNLKPETSDGIEGGLRGAFKDGSSFSLVGFYTVYKDFIENRAVGQDGAFTLFQSVNLDKVTIYGAEAKGRWQFAPHWALQGAIAYAYGENDETGQPVDSVDPLKAVLGLRYEDPDNWGAELIGTAVAPHDAVSDSAYFNAPGYGTVDLIGFWNFNKNLSLNAGVFNILDKKYWVAQDVVAVNQNSAQLDLYTQPGITFAVNAVLRW